MFTFSLIKQYFFKKHVQILSWWFYFLLDLIYAYFLIIYLFDSIF